MAFDAARAKKKVEQTVKDLPGLNLRQVQRYSAIPLSTTNRFLIELEEEKRISSETKRNRRHYYPKGKGFNKEFRTVLQAVNQPRPRRIIEQVLAHPDARHDETAKLVGIPAPTLTYHMKQLVRDSIIRHKKEATEVRYRVNNKPLVRRALQRTKAFDNKRAL